MSWVNRDEWNVWELTRRGFFVVVGAFFTFVAGLVCVGAGIRFVWPAVLFEPPSVKKIGKPTDIPENDFRFIEDLKVYVFRGGSNKYHAVSAVCTHLRCTVAYQADSDSFYCPCHGGVFDNSGKVAAGPPPKPLPFFEVTLAPDGQLVVDTSVCVASDKRFQC